MYNALKHAQTYQANCQALVFETERSQKSRFASQFLRCIEAMFGRWRANIFEFLRRCSWGKLVI